MEEENKKKENIITNILIIVGLVALMCLLFIQNNRIHNLKNEAWDKEYAIGRMQFTNSMNEANAEMRLAIINHQRDINTMLDKHCNYLSSLTNVEIARRLDVVYEQLTEIKKLVETK